MRRGGDRRGRAANELESFRFSLIKVPAALLYRSQWDKSFHSKDMSVLESNMEKPDMFAPDITFEDRSEDKTYKRKSAFSVICGFLRHLQENIYRAKFHKNYS